MNNEDSEMFLSLWSRVMIQEFCIIFSIFQIRKAEVEDESEPQKDAIEEKRAEDGSAEVVDDEDNKYKKTKGTEKLSTGLAVVILLFCFGIFGLVLLMDNRLPKPLTLTG